ncbi:uncharacterized protein EV154DRAFT_478510 [Mucor mucedo]|uniref:uncharacterized protein n=1 Tax=Mucor mucedo TaxID=29922 RepID=UPI00221E75E9|nr:uncharacterized protein EV154DRAFT_478510 [Mucor mucedo]KAI7894262.1 hypothetical protein EV154DRAFT_478510 [Mucor mucedo]
MIFYFFPSLLDLNKFYSFIADENVILPTPGAAAEDSHRDTPDASTTFDNDNHANISLDNYTYADENKYKIDNVNVGELFKKYQLKAAKQIEEKGCFLESDIQELLAINNILLIKPGQASLLVSSIFNEACILSIRHEIKQIFGTIDSADIHTDVKTITMTKAAKKLNDVLSDDDCKNYDDMIVIGIRNLLEILPKYKFNGLINENQAGCSYANPVLSPIFNNPDKRSHLHCKVNYFNRCFPFEVMAEVLESNSKQPDFGGNVLEHSNWVGPVLVGEVKGEDRKDDVYMCLMDLFRIGSLSMESINHNKYKGFIGIQVIGMQVTFSISTLLSKSFYVMMEICSITLPKDLTEIMSYFANVSDMMPVLQYYENSFELINNLISESHMDTIIDAKKIGKLIKSTRDLKAFVDGLLETVKSLLSVLLLDD